MTTITVKTQSELDAALARTDLEIIYIDSPRGVWLGLSSSGSATVRAYGSTTVEAYGSATVEASGSTTVEASGSATVEASGSATVEAYGSATVEAYGSATVRASGSATVEASDSTTVRAYGSTTVEAYGSATVEAYGSATVEASGSTTVRAYGSATVEAYGSTTVRASDSTTVRAYGSTTVEAYDSATVRAGTHVAVHLHSARATIQGGVVIDITKLDLEDAPTWCGYHGVEIRDGNAILYKATNDQVTAGQEHDRPTVYTPGATVTAEDWRDDHRCGGGLHVSQTPHHASRYRDEPRRRYLRVSAPLDGIRVLGADKVKTPTLTVLAEVDGHGRDLAPAEPTA